MKTRGYLRMRKKHVTGDFAEKRGDVGVATFNVRSAGATFAHGVSLR